MAKPTHQQQVEIQKQKLMSQLGKSGVVLLKGVISQEEYNKELDGQRGLEVWDKMRRGDGTVKAGLRVIKLMLRQANWRLQAASDDPQDMLALQLCEKSLFDNINFDRFLNEATSYIEMGFSLFEQVFKIDTVDGREYALLDSMLFLKQRSIVKWEIGGDSTLENDGQPGVTQQSLTGTGQNEIPAWKLSHFVFDQEGENMQGVSILRPAYKHWYMKDTLYQVDAIKHEKQGLGVLKIQTPSTAKDADKQAARDIAREQRANEEAYIEELEGFKFDFMDMKAGTTTDIMPSINHHNRQILQSMLAQFLDIGSQSSSGSYSASSTQLDVFLQSEQAFAKEIAAVINESVIKNICWANGLFLEEYPKLTFDRIGQDNVQTFSEAINKLFTSGAVTPDPLVEAYIRELLHLPEMTEDMIENYDDIRATRRNPSLPSTASPEANAPTEASDLINEARTMRQRLHDASRN